MTFEMMRSLGKETMPSTMIQSFTPNVHLNAMKKDPTVASWHESLSDRLVVLSAFDQQERDFFSSLDQVLNLQCYQSTKAVDAVTGAYQRHESDLGKRSLKAGFVPQMKKRKENMTEEQKKILNEWFTLNIDNPYPSEEVKNELSSRTNLDRRKIDNYFVNTRRRKLSHDGKGIPMRPQIRDKLNFQRMLAQRLSVKETCQTMMIGTCTNCTI